MECGANGGWGPACAGAPPIPAQCPPQIPPPQDLIVCVLLSEGAYKAADVGVDAATTRIAGLARTFPPSLVPPLRLQWTLAAAEQACVLADCPRTNALYVAFRGTKRPPGTSPRKRS